MSGLVTHVSLRDDAGSVVSFWPGDDVPAWARKRITNPAVWDSPPAAESEEEPQKPQSDGGSSDDEIPPQSGAGSGRDAWAAYAAKKGVEVGEDEKRDAIIDKLTAAGVPVE